LFSLAVALSVGVFVGMSDLEGTGVFVAPVGLGAYCKQVVKFVPVRPLHGSVGVVGLGVTLVVTVGFGVLTTVLLYAANCRSSPVRCVCMRATIKNVVAANTISRTSGSNCIAPCGEAILF